MSSQTSPANSPAERYAALLNEAASIRGVSLWLDAWRRLRKNYAAMGSLICLVVIATLAFLTPLLPLQSPQFIRLTKQDQYQPPRWTAASLGVTRANVQKFDEELANLRAESNS